MNSFLFDEWVKKLDKKFEKENREAILIVNNCPAYPIIEGLKAVELVFMPWNTTSKTQPMDQGVIRSLKAKYCKKIIQRLIRAVDLKKKFPKTSVLDALQWLTSASSEVSEAIIKNCFTKAQISEKLAEKAINDQDDPFKDLWTEKREETINKFRERLPNEVPEELNAAVLLDINPALSTNRDKPRDAEILAEIQGEAIQEEHDIGVVYDESPAPPSAFEIANVFEILQQFTLFCDKGGDLQDVLPK